MSDSSEQIEARLCAYIDGALEVSERAEIEAHLAGNPQHRQLMEQLIRTRRLLADLPRATAPPDLTDALQAQLERSGLLDEERTGDEVENRRIRPWSHILAVAAVLLLVLGLGAVLFFVLSPPGAMERFADVREPAPLPLASAPAADPDALAAVPPGRTERRDLDLLKERGAGVAGGGSSVEGLAGGMADRSRDRLPEVAAAPLKSAGLLLNSAAVNEQLSKELADSENRRVLLVVNTSRVAEASGEIDRYLNLNDISSSNYRYDSDARLIGQAKLDGEAKANGGAQPAPTGPLQDNKGPELNLGQELARQGQSQLRQLPAQAMEQELRNSQTQQQYFPRQNRSTGWANSQSNVAQSDVAQANAAQAAAPAAVANASDQGVLANNVIVARNMKRSQTEELRQVLAQRRLAEPAVVLELAKTESAAKPMDQRLAIDVRAGALDESRLGYRAATRSLDTAATAPAARPMTQPAEAVASAAPSVMRAERLWDKDQVSAHRSAATAPVTQPSSQPTTAAADDGPKAAATDEAVDLVIVVQSEPASTQPALPATLPE